MVIQAKIRKRDNTGAVVDCLPTDKPVPYSGFLYQMWSDIHVEFQHKEFHKTDNYYDILTYLQLLYNTPNETKATQLWNALWHRDEAGSHSAIRSSVEMAPGEYRRGITVARSRLFELKGRLICDATNINRPLPEGVSVTFRFFPNPQNKCILSENENSTWVIEVHDFYLMVPRIKPKAALLKQPAQYPWVKSSVHRLLINQGAQHFGPKTVLATDNLPKKCLVMFWTEQQLNGKANLSRLALNHHSVEQMVLAVNGEQLPYYGGYEINMKDNIYGELYDALFTTLGSPSTVDVSKGDFKGGFIVFPFELTQKNLPEQYYAPKKKGNIELTIRFRDALAENLVCLVIFEQERVLSFGKSRDWTDKAAP